MRPAVKNHISSHDFPDLFSLSVQTNREKRETGLFSPPPDLFACYRKRGGEDDVVTLEDSNGAAAYG